jgi:hypothetical protein
MADDDFVSSPGPGGDDDGGTAAPSDERLSRFESRLNDVSEAIGALARNQDARDVRSRISQRTAQVDAALRTSERAVDLAEEALATAYEGGESAVIARAQRELSERIASREHARGDKRTHDQALKEIERRGGGSQGAPGAHVEKQDQTGAKDTANLDGWRKKHSSWYGIDAEMTKAAHEVDRAIREAGVIPVGSQQYFQAIDRQMAKSYPDQLRSAPETGSGSSSGRTAPRHTGRIPGEVVEGWRHMGINVDDPATMERMIGHRSHLAGKGILPDAPAYGIVRPR